MAIVRPAPPLENFGLHPVPLIGLLLGMYDVLPRRMGVSSYQERWPQV